MAASEPTGTMTDRDIETLYRRHGRSLFRCIMTMTFGDRHLAEDIIQETMLRAWRYPALRTDNPAATRAWLTTVARNLVIDRLRQRRIRPVEDGDARLDSVPDLAGSLDRMLLSITLESALARLTPAGREVVVELYLRDRSLDEVAETLGIPLGTVKSRAHYAVRALRRLFEGQGDDATALPAAA